MALAQGVPASREPRIVWDQRTLTLIQRGAGYGRAIRQRGGDILCVYSLGRKVWVRSSRDNGKTWRPPALVADCRFGVATNPEILQLHNGWILCSYNERPQDRTHRFTIMTCISRDGGPTWSRPRLAYEADVLRKNGCWEPAQIQLPNGEVQLFFANESPYRHSAEQEITLLRSHDSGQSWSAPRRVSFRKGKRDGMPVPLVLRNGKGTVVAIEDNGLAGRFKPVIVSSSSEDNWNGPFVDGASPRRWRALEAPLKPGVYAGAPYIRQMPTGETVLSVQSTEGGRTKPQMVVYVGDDRARHFAGRSVPFRIPPDTAGLWNSLFVKDASTVTAISGTAVDGVHGLWAIDGRLTRGAGVD